MITLLTSEAVELVRKNLEELDTDGSAMYPGPTDVGSADEYGDEQSLNSIIARNLPEAINAVQMASPVQLLEGKEHLFTRHDTVVITPDSTEDEHSSGVIAISIVENSHYLRLVAFQADDSPIVVTDVLSEASPEGRKQLNKYIRGRADRPRLVFIQGTHTNPQFKYYSLTDVSAYMAQPKSAIKHFSYIEEQFYIAPTEQVADPGYPISRKLRQNIVDYLTSMVLATYNDQRSQLYIQKASVYPGL